MQDCYLITGASSGLGAGFARALAAEGHALALVARRADRLAEIADALRAAHGVRIATFSADLVANGAVARLIGDLATQDMRPTHLINNAGIGFRGTFAELDGASQLRMIDLNCRVPTELAHALLPDMLAAGRGGILNIASTAAFQPGPWMAVYYATKAYLLSFSEALHEEVRDKGVTVCALCPGPTRTEFFSAGGMEDSLLNQSFAGDAEKVVRDGLAAFRANRAVKVSGALNAALAGSIRATPRALARGLAARLNRRRV